MKKVLLSAMMQAYIIHARPSFEVVLTEAAIPQPKTKRGKFKRRNRGKK